MKKFEQSLFKTSAVMTLPSPYFHRRRIVQLYWPLSIHQVGTSSETAVLVSNVIKNTFDLSPGHKFRNFHIRYAEKNTHWTMLHQRYKITHTTCTGLAIGQKLWFNALFSKLLGFQETKIAILSLQPKSMQTSKRMDWGEREIWGKVVR
jgi:hypothetical protein